MNRTPVIVQLDRERVLRFDLNALCLLEEKTGQVFSVLTRRLSLTNVRLLIWAGLIHEQPDLTPEQVGAMVELRDVRELTGKVHEAMGMLPEEENETPTRAVPVTAQPIGQDSGVSEDSISALVTPNSGD